MGNNKRYDVTLYIGGDEGSYDCIRRFRMNAVEFATYCDILAAARALADTADRYEHIRFWKMGPLRIEVEFINRLSDHIAGAYDKLDNAMWTLTNHTGLDGGTGLPLEGEWEEFYKSIKTAKQTEEPLAEEGK